MARDNNRTMRRRVRTSYMISTVSVALVLFLLGTVSYLILNAAKATNTMRESITVNVMLRDRTGIARADEIGELLRRHPSIRKVEFVSREQAAAEFKEYIGDDFETFLGTNPLPDSYRIGLKPEASQKEAMAKLEKEVLSWEGVEEVVYQKTVVEQITANIRKFMLVLLLFGGTLLLISIILLRNTIRAAVYSKRYIINTMKLVGATRWFILRPFVADSLLQGVYAGLISTAMFVIMVAGIKEGLPNMTLMLDNMQMVSIVAAMFVLGILISVVFTTLAVNKFINMRSNQIQMF